MKNTKTKPQFISPQELQDWTREYQIGDKFFNEIDEYRQFKKEQKKRKLQNKETKT